MCGRTKLHANPTQLAPLCLQRAHALKTHILFDGPQQKTPTRRTPELGFCLSKALADWGAPRERKPSNRLQNPIRPAERRRCAVGDRP